MGEEAIVEQSPLRINRELDFALKAVTVEEPGAIGRQRLGELLQAALRLEFAIIPVYLSAALSLGVRNRAIAELLTRAAIEEMLHFIVVANTMNAIGIAPDVAGAVPSYPADIDVVEPPLHLEVRSFSLELVNELFLRVETPEDPIVFKSTFIERTKTVGEFYEGIIEIIESDKIPGLFGGDPQTLNAPILPAPPASFRRVDYRYDGEQGEYLLPPSIDFKITDKASAVRHLRWVVDQGEGTSRTDRNPIDQSGLPAHYYRFVSILKGKYLVEDAGAANGYSYSGASLPFDPTAVFESDPNPKVADFAGHAGVARSMNIFNRRYSAMIDSLIVAFGTPDRAAAEAAYQQSIGSMRSMTGLVSAIYRAAGQAGVKAGPSFENQRT